MNKTIEVIENCVHCGCRLDSPDEWNVLCQKCINDWVKDLKKEGVSE